MAITITRGNCSEVIFKGKPVDSISMNGEIVWDKKGETVTYANLADGETVYRSIDYSANGFIPSITPPPIGVRTIDISVEQNGSILTWFDKEDSNSQYYYTTADRINAPVSMDGMFYRLGNLYTVDLQNVYTNNTTSMANMFIECNQLTSINIPNFNTSKVVDFRNMFDKVGTFKYPLKTPCVTVNWGPGFVLSDDVYAKCIEMDFSEDNPTYRMFYNEMMDEWSYTIVSIPTKIITMPSGGNWNKSLICNDLTDGTFTPLAPENMLHGVALRSVIYDVETEFESFERSTTPPPEGVSARDASMNKNGNIVTWYDETSKTQYWYSTYPTVYTPVNSTGLFRDMHAKKISLVGLDTSKTTNMDGMFNRCSLITEIDLSGFDTSSVTKMDNMFQSCANLVSLDLSNFNTSNVTNMGMMFYSCHSLTSINVSSFDTSNVTHFYTMFSDCTALTKVNLSNFNTSKAINISEMFAWCTSMDAIDVSMFNTTNVEEMNALFKHCPLLTSLDLSNFDTSKTIKMQNMFEDSTNLTTINYGTKFILSDEAYNLSFNDPSTIYNNIPAHYMFNNCPANKPTGGNWDKGTWDKAGTFMKPV